MNLRAEPKQIFATCEVHATLLFHKTFWLSSLPNFKLFELGDPLHKFHPLTEVSQHICLFSHPRVCLPRNEANMRSEEDIIIVHLKLCLVYNPPGDYCNIRAIMITQCTSCWCFGVNISDFEVMYDCWKMFSLAMGLKLEHERPPTICIRKRKTNILYNYSLLLCIFLSLLEYPCPVIGNITHKNQTFFQWREKLWGIYEEGTIKMPCNPDSSR